ncbi:MAG: DinB family protein [Flavobacteriales bacterium]|nr:DinB family protein [Flavobacteriales bacterium]
MKALQTNVVIRELQAELKSQLSKLDKLEKLPLDLLNRKPSPKSWSVLETVDHMCLSSGFYLQGLQKIYEKNDRSVKHSAQVVPGRLGSFFTEGMKPKKDGTINWKMKTMARFQPDQSVSSSEALLEFRTMLVSFERLVDLADQHGMNGEKVVSTLGPLVKFRIVDAFRFPVAHQARHFLQIDRTLDLVMRSN